MRSLLFGHAVHGRDAKSGEAFMITRTEAGAVTATHSTTSETGQTIIEGDRLKHMSFKNGETYTPEAAAHDAVSVAQGGTASVKDEATRRAAFGDKKAGWGDAHRAQFLDLINAIRNNTQPLLDGPAARKPVEVVLSIYESSRTGQRVNVADIAQRETANQGASLDFTVFPATRRAVRPEPATRA